MPALPLLAPLALCFALATGADKPAPPPAPPVSMSKAPDATGSKAISDFTGWVFGQIETGPDESIREARKSATDLLSSKDCTPVFYNAFFKASEPSIVRIARSGQGYRATNALFVLRAIRCPEALDLMLKECNAKEQPVASVRIAAGAMLTAMLGGKDAPLSDAEGLAREIGRNVAEETSPLAAARLVEALCTLMTAADGAKMAPQARSALMTLITAAKVTAKRAGEAGQEDFAGATFRALIGIRDQCVKMSGKDHDDIGQSADFRELLSAVNALRFSAEGKTADAARELAGAREVAKALSSMFSSDDKQKPAKK